MKRLLPIVMLSVALVIGAGPCGRQAATPVGIAYVAAAHVVSGPDPTVTVTCDVTQLAAGDAATFTATVASPTSETQKSVGVVLTFQPTGPLTATTGTAPMLITNSATVSWAGGSATSNSVPVRLLGSTVAVTPTSGTFTVALGDFNPGDSCNVMLKAKAP